MIQSSLLDLCTACLISEGYLYVKNAEHFVKCHIKANKAFYLTDFIEEHKLSNQVTYNLNKEELKIRVDNQSFEILSRWYKDESKIFSNRIDRSKISKRSWLLCINLFANRKIEKLTIGTNIIQDNLPILTHSLQNYFSDVPIICNKNTLEIHNVPFLYKQVLDSFNLIHAIEFSFFLMSQERNKMVKQNFV